MLYVVLLTTGSIQESWVFLVDQPTEAEAIDIATAEYHRQEVPVGDTVAEYPVTAEARRFEVALGPGGLGPRCCQQLIP